LFAVTLVGVTALLIGTLSYTRAARALETTARTRLVLLARDVAATIGRELENRAADTTNWSRLEVMRALIYQDVDKELAQFFEQMQRGRPTYKAIVGVDALGRPVAGAGEAIAIQPHEPGGRSRLSIVATGKGLLQFETSVVNPERPTDVIGGLIVLLDLHGMSDTLQVSSDGTTRPVSLTLRSRAGEVILDAPLTSAMPATSMLSAVATIAPLPDTDGPELEVVVGESTATAFADVASLRATLLQTLLLVVALGAVFGAVVAWRIGRPIRQLTDTVRAVAERGQPEPNVSFPETSGEVGVLASAFKTMMESLAAAQRDALAKSRLAFLGEIAANIAHEVRTPLSVLKTAAQLLARGGMAPAEQRELATTAAAEVDRLNTVVTNLVDLARPQRVHYRLERLDPIVDRAVAFFGPLASKSGIEVTRVPSDGSLVVHASADQLHQVMLNLLQNAVQAVNGTGAVTVRSRAEDGTVRIEVDDSGPGFASDVLPRVFAPFVTTKADGTGLGLAIVKRMIEEHGGTVGAENLPGGGARVWVQLPRRPTEAA
jgi:signal transduction histidine kinase